MALTIKGYFSETTGKVYSKKAIVKGVETKAAQREYAQKLEQLQAKFNHKL